jgi:hypothetical protein
MSTQSLTTSSSGYAFGRPQNKCTVCGRVIASGEKFTAAVREGPAGLERLDVDAACWDGLDKNSLLAFWRSTMPVAGASARPKVFVDDAVLCDLFDRLADSPVGEDVESQASAPAKLSFRFVLGLILLRKRLLAHDATHAKDGQEYWTVHLKGRDQPIDLLNPHLDEQQITQVSEQLGQVLSGDPA